MKHSQSQCFQLKMKINITLERENLYLPEQISLRYKLVCCLGSKLFQHFCDPMDCSPPGSSVHGIFRQEYWSGLPFCFPGDLPDPGIGTEPMSPALTGGFFATWAIWEAHRLVIYLKYVPEIQCLNKIILLISWPKFHLFSTLEIKEFILLLSAFPQLFTITLRHQ